MIMTKSRKLFTVALAAVAVGALSLGAVGPAFAGKKHHHHHGHHHKFYRSVVVISTADDDDCEWKWYRARNGVLFKKWVCD
jgi:hypothetical protein